MPASTHRGQMEINFLSMIHARRGIYTTGIISDTDEGKIILYLTGSKHAGENIERISQERKNSKQLILVSDAISGNNKSDFEFLRSYCLTHGYRKFFDFDYF